MSGRQTATSGVCCCVIGDDNFPCCQHRPKESLQVFELKIWCHRIVDRTHFIIPCDIREGVCPDIRFTGWFVENFADKAIFRIRDVQDFIEHDGKCFVNISFTDVLLACGGNGTKKAIGALDVLFRQLTVRQVT